MGEISYETHFKSTRKDGRHTLSLASFDEALRAQTPKLQLPDDLTEESYRIWRKKVQEKYQELLRMPEIKRQEAPVKLSSQKRDGYTVERWEFYPDEYTVSPFLVLIPDGVSKQNKAPGVICMPGSVFSKEFLAGEETLEPYNCRFDKYPERNKMALYIVKNGMVAFVFDHLATAELGIPTTDPNVDRLNYYSRAQMVSGYLKAGLNYVGMSTYRILSFMQYLDAFDYVDQDRLGVCSHSLGTQVAWSIGVLCDQIKAIVFNDVLMDDKVRFISNTEMEEGNMDLDVGNWHIIPGLWEYFTVPDLCSAFAPKFVAFNEGGADEWHEKVRRAYAVLGAEDRLQVTHYPKYQDETTRKYHGKVPRYGLSSAEYYDWNYCDAPDHSFRAEPSLKLLKKAFHLS